MRTRFIKIVGTIAMAASLMFISFYPANAAGDWHAGQKMGIKIKLKETGISVKLRKNVEPEIGIVFEFIDCCVKANQNTACNRSAQDTRC